MRTAHAMAYHRTATVKRARLRARLWSLTAAGLIALSVGLVFTIITGFSQ